MADVPTVSAPTVAQSGGAIGVPAPAAAFGANVLGAGLKEASAAATETSNLFAQRAEQLQALNNKAEADNLNSNFSQDLATFHNKWQTSNTGRAAQDTYPEALKTVATLRDDYSARATNPMAAALFDQESRKNATFATNNMASHAASEMKGYRIASSKGVQSTFINTVSNDQTQWAAGVGKFVEAQSLIDQELGVPPELGAGNIRVELGKAANDIATNLASGGDPQGAKAFLEAHKGEIDAGEYRKTLRSLAPAFIAADAAQAGDRAVSSAVGVVGGDYLSTTHRLEGDGKNPRSSATGTGQFINSTWLKVMHSDPQFAEVIKGKTDAQILALRSDPALGDRATLSLADTNAKALTAAGLPVTASTVGLAHHFGAAGAAALLHAPASEPMSSLMSHEVMAANPDLAGKTVGDVVTAYHSHFGAGPVDQNAFNNTGHLTSYGYESLRPQVIANADAQWAVSPYSSDYRIRDQYRQRAMEQLNLLQSGAKGRENGALSTLLQGTLNPGVQDPAALFGAVPQGLQLYNSLPSEDRLQVDSHLRSNASMWTPDRSANQEKINGIKAKREQDPTSYAALNIGKMDLTTGVKVQELEDQAKWKAGKLKADESDKALNRFTQSSLYGSTLRALGLGVTRGDDDQMVGALRTEITAWEGANANKVPTDKDMPPILARVVARLTTTSKGWFGLGAEETKFTGVDADTKEVAIAQLKAQGVLVPSEFQIGQMARALQIAKGQ